jgi:hypothetical protein
LANVEITGLKKMVKLVSFCLKTQADMMLHMCECCRQQGRRDYSNFIGNENSMGWEGRSQVIFTKYVTSCIILHSTIPCCVPSFNTLPSSPSTLFPSYLVLAFSACSLVWHSVSPRGAALIVF